MDPNEGNPFEPPETDEQRAQRVRRMTHGNVDAAMGSICYICWENHQRREKAVGRCSETLRVVCHAHAAWCIRDGHNYTLLNS